MPLADAKQTVVEQFVRSIKPKERLSVSQWADQHRIMAVGTTPHPGRWKTDRVPYAREPMDALSVHHSAQIIVLRWASQVSKTEIGLNWIGYSIAQNPQTMIAVQPTETMMKKMVQTRLNGILDSDVFKGIIADPKSRQSANTMQMKQFVGGHLHLNWAGSSSAAKSISAGALYLDEVDEYEKNLGEQGDTISLYLARTSNYERTRKILLTSTPTVRGNSTIDDWYDKGSQADYQIPCPHCDEYQPLVFDNLRWDKNKPQTAQYFCKFCGAAIEEYQKNTFLSLGKWVHAKPENTAILSYHLSALYSPYGWKSWKELARLWEDAHGNIQKIKVFVNTVKAVSFEIRGEAPEWQRLYERRENYAFNELPTNPVAILAGVDVQKDRIECHIVALGENREWWSLDLRVFKGDPSSLDNKCWQDLAEVFLETWKHKKLGKIKLHHMCVDTGYHAQVVMAFVKKIGYDRCSPIKGRQSIARAVWSSALRETAKRRKTTGKIFNLGVDLFKAELYGYLRLTNTENITPYGWVHFPQYNQEFFKQLTAEQRVPKKMASGKVVYRWVLKHENNEALDTFVYVMAAAVISGVNEWTPRDWNKCHVQTKRKRIASQTSIF